MPPEQKINPMQADEFEKKIKNKLQEFALAPGEAVWDEVAQRINKEKMKRRVLVYWLAAGFILLAGVSAYLFINKRENATGYVDIKTNPEKESYKIKQNTNRTTSEFKKLDKKTFTKTTAYKKNNNEVSVRKYQSVHQAFTQTENAKAFNKNFSEISKKDPKNIVIRKEQTTELLSHKFYNPYLTARINDRTSLATNKNLTSQKDTFSNSNIKKSIAAKKQIRKWKAGFNIYGGLSDNLSGLPGLDKSLAYDAAPSNNATGGYTGYTQNITSNFKASFSFGFGFFVKKQLGKRVSLPAGIDYRLYKVTSRVGRSITLNSMIYDSVDQRYTSSNNYYRIGDTASYSNNYHFLQLPVNLELQINKNLQKPFVVFAGISPGYIISSNALYTNGSANISYVDKQKFRKFSLSAQAGFSFPLIGSSAYLLSAGPTIQYSFTNLIKFAGAEQHLSFAGIKATVVLK